jgi:uncharacterized membrane protein HdeD (DUF308 family)
MRKGKLITGVVLAVLGIILFALRTVTTRHFIVRAESLIGILLLVAGIVLAVLGYALKTAKNKQDSFHMGY